MVSGSASIRPASDAWVWRTAIVEFLTWARRQRKASTTITTWRDHLTYLSRCVSVGPWDLTEDELLDWFADHQWKANTYRSRRTTLRAFYRWALETGKTSTSPAGGIPRVDPAPPNPLPVPDRVYDAALATADDRVALMCMLAAGHGMRRAEVALVWPERDLIEDLEGWSLIVHGKGSKERVVPLEAETTRILRSMPPGYAFPGRIEGHLSPRYVGILVSRQLEGGWTMHKLRHRAATSFLEDSDNDVRVVQELLGHANLNTTMLYVPANAKRWRKAVNGGRSNRAAALARRHSKTAVVGVLRHDEVS